MIAGGVSSVVKWDCVQRPMSLHRVSVLQGGSYLNTSRKRHCDVYVTEIINPPPAVVLFQILDSFLVLPRALFCS